MNEIVLSKFHSRTFPKYGDCEMRNRGAQYYCRAENASLGADIHISSLCEFQGILTENKCLLCCTFHRAAANLQEMYGSFQMLSTLLVP